MEFCQGCGTRLILMLSSSPVLACRRCGEKKTSNGGGNLGSRVTGRTPVESVIVIDQEVAGLRGQSTVKVNCPKCGGNRAYFRTVEFSEEDETIEVQVFKCTQCGRTWRERG